MRMGLICARGGPTGVTFFLVLPGFGGGGGLLLAVRGLVGLGFGREVDWAGLAAGVAAFFFFSVCGGSTLRHFFFFGVSSLSLPVPVLGFSSSAKQSKSRSSSRQVRSTSSAVGLIPQVAARAYFLQEDVLFCLCVGVILGGINVRHGDESV